LDGVEQKEVNAALCGSLCNLDGVCRPLCVVAVVDSDTVVRDAFHSGQNASHQLVDGLRGSEAVSNGDLCAVVDNRSGQCLAHRDDLGRVAYRPVNNLYKVVAQ
jgi:hypothetical protein